MEEASKMLNKHRYFNVFNKIRLAPGVAALIANHSGNLGLYSLKQISAEDAQSLAQHRGRLYLGGLSSVATEALEALAKHEGSLILNGLSHLSEEQAEALGQHKGSLSLDRVDDLPAAVAFFLAKNDGPLHLSAVRVISLEAAEALSRHKGPLHLWEVSQLSDEVAEALVKHQGPVGIFPLADMSDKARMMLRKHREDVCNEQGLPQRSQFKELAGTFQLVPSDEFFPSKFIYYPRLPDPGPIFLHIHWRDDWVGQDKRPPSELPTWFVSFLPKIGECIERIYLEGLPGGDTPRYLLDVSIEVVTDKLHSMSIQTVDSDGGYWETIVDDHGSPGEYMISCWGGNHYNSASYLSALPINHSIHESKLEGLKFWQH
jgi:hypothetical protein